jgi:hypothetical protein
LSKNPASITIIADSILLIFLTILGQMANNVPAVYDVFASPIKETAGFLGLQKCGWSEPWE